MNTPHRGPEASQNVHRGPKVRTERFSIVLDLDLRWQLGAITYIDTDGLGRRDFPIPCEHQLRHFRTPFPAVTPDHKPPLELLSFRVSDL